MSRDKQIDYKGFANQMRQNAYRNADGNIVCTEEVWELIASVVEGKQADVAEEIFAEIAKATGEWGCYFITTSKMGYLTSDVHRTLAELKKKYIGKDTNVTTKESEDTE